MRRLRTGHHSLLRSYLSSQTWNWKDASPEEKATRLRSCPHCGSTSSIQHLLLDCPDNAAATSRDEILAKGLASWSAPLSKPNDVLREALFEKPGLTITFLQAAGFMDGFQVYTH